MLLDRLHTCGFELACSGTGNMVRSLYTAVRLNRISSIPLDSVLLKVILHLDHGSFVFRGFKAKHKNKKKSMLVPHKAMRQATHARYSRQCMEFSAAGSSGPFHSFLSTESPVYV